MKLESQNQITSSYSLDFSGHHLFHRHFGVVEVANNGERNDAAVELNVGLGYHRAAPSEILAIAYLSTNGDPVVIATTILTDSNRHDTDWNQLRWAITETDDGDPIPLQPWIVGALTTVLGIDADDLSPNVQANEEWEKRYGSDVTR